MKFLAIGTLLTGTLLLSQSAPPARVGPQPDGSVLLPTGWTLRPAGQQIPLDTFPMSAVLTPDGRFLLVVHGGSQPPSIAVLDAKSLKQVSKASVPDAWLGLAIAPNGKSVYAGGGSKGSVFEFTLSEQGALTAARTFALADGNPQQQDFVGDVALSPDGRLLYAAIVHRDTIAVINPLSGIVIERIRTGRRPYRILFPPDGKSFYVSSWADASILQHKAETGERLNLIRIGPQPMDMVWSGPPATTEQEGERADWQARIFVTAANTNNVYAVGIGADGGARVVENISIALTPRQPAGMTPSGLALNADGTRLYVACSDANAVAVADVSGARTPILGFVPTGEYPTGARVLPDGRVFILNGGGAQGSASVVGPDDLQTEVVRRNSAYREELLYQTAASNAIVPASPAGKSPIEHVIYIAVGSTAGSTPNWRKLAAEFARLDNYHAIGGVAADSTNWATSAIAPSYVARLSPGFAAGRRTTNDFEGGEPAAFPPAGRLWNNAIAKRIAFRNYGWWVTNKPTAAAGEIQIAGVRDPVLKAVTNERFRGPDPAYPDADRAKVFVQDLGNFERENNLPGLTMIRLGDDSDPALGTIVEALSRSKFWKSTAIFIAPTHAAAQSSLVPALVVSPYTRGRGADATFYNTASILRTMELILGLNPMTQFDAAATPMAAAFREEAVGGVYSAERP